jgi:hypothetical protein
MDLGVAVGSVEHDELVWLEQPGAVNDDIGVVGS